MLGALEGHRLRSFLSALGVAIGVGAVVMLTSLGEGTRQHLVEQFSQFGTNLLSVTPGKVKTLGLPGVLGGTTHFLTIDDAEALRRVPGVNKVVPVAFGPARVEAGPRGRSVFIYGLNHEGDDAWSFHVAQGTFLPEIDPHRQASLVVLGPKVARELFQTPNFYGTHGGGPRIYTNPIFGTISGRKSSKVPGTRGSTTSRNC